MNTNIIKINPTEIDTILTDIIDIDDNNKLGGPEDFNMEMEFKLKSGKWGILRGGTFEETIKAQELVWNHLRLKVINKHDAEEGIYEITEAEALEQAEAEEEIDTIYLFKDRAVISFYADMETGYFRRVDNPSPDFIEKITLYCRRDSDIRDYR